MLLGLSVPTEPLFGDEARQQLLAGVGPGQRSPRAAALRGILDGLCPRRMTRVFLLFQFLHHHWVNQEDRARSLQQMAFLFAPMLFTTAEAELGHCGGAGDAGAPRPPATEEEVVLASATAFLISNFRALFAQPANLERWRQDGVDTGEQAESQEEPGPGRGAEEPGPGQGAGEPGPRPAGYDPEAASACILACSPPPAAALALSGYRSPCLTRCSSSEAEDEELGRCLDTLLSQLITEYVAPGSGDKRGNQPGSPTDVLTDVCAGPTPADDLETSASGCSGGEPAATAAGPLPQSPSAQADRWAGLRVRTAPH